MEVGVRGHVDPYALQGGLPGTGGPGSLSACLRLWAPFSCDSARPVPKLEEHPESELQISFMPLQTNRVAVSELGTWGAIF